MRVLFQDLICELFHSGWATPVSYSRQGSWACLKPGCPAQARHDAALSSRQRMPAPVRVPVRQPVAIYRGHKRAA